MAMLKKSRRNLQACTEVGLISRVLGMLENAGDIVAGNMQGSGKHLRLARLIEISVNRSIYNRKTIIDMKIKKIGYF